MNLKIFNFHKLSIAFTVWFIIFISCNNPDKAKNNLQPHPLEKFYGNWLCTNLIDSIKQRKSLVSIFKDLELPFAYELQFDESFNDSVLIYNGFEQFFLRASISHDTLKLHNAIKGKSLLLIYDSVASTLKNTIRSKDNPVPLRFIRADKKYIQPNGNYAEAFPSLINDATIAGNYILLDSKTKSLIEFETNGALKGISGATKYICCTGGDCLAMMQNRMNSLSLIMKDKSSEYRAWQLSANNDTLTLKNVKAININEPGTYVTTAETMVLVRIK